MPELRVLISGICAFVCEQRLETSPTSMFVLMPELTIDRAVRLETQNPRYGVIASHFPMLEVPWKHIHKSTTRNRDLCFRRFGRDEKPEVTGVFFLWREGLQFRPDGKDLEPESLESYWVPPEANKPESLCWLPALEGNLKRELTQKPPRLNDALAARIDLPSGKLVVHELTRHPPQRRVPAQNANWWLTTLPLRDMSNLGRPHPMPLSLRWTLEFENYVEIKLVGGGGIHPTQIILSVEKADRLRALEICLKNRELEDILRPPFDGTRSGVFHDEDFSVYHDLIEDGDPDGARRIPVLRLSDAPPTGYGGGAGGTGKPCISTAIHPSIPPTGGGCLNPFSLLRRRPAR